MKKGRGERDSGGMSALPVSGFAKFGQRCGNLLYVLDPEKVLDPDDVHGNNGPQPAKRTVRSRICTDASHDATRAGHGWEKRAVLHTNIILE